MRPNESLEKNKIKSVYFYTQCKNRLYMKVYDKVQLTENYKYWHQFLKDS